MPKLFDVVNAKLLIIGDGPELSKLKTLTSKLNLNDKIKFLGSLNHETTLSYIKSADIFVLPSLYEGMSHLMLEAMMYKTIVVGSNIPGNVNLIKDKENGFIYNSDNQQQLIETLLYIYLNKQKIKKLEDAAYKNVKSIYNWDNHIKKLQQYFSEISSYRHPLSN